MPSTTPAMKPLKVSIPDTIASARPLSTVGTRLSIASLMLCVADSSMPSSPRAVSS